VAIAAHDDKVMVAYHTGPASEDQHISLMLVQAIGELSFCFHVCHYNNKIKKIGYNLRCRDIRMPLSATAKLTWLGYSDKGSPITYDSNGMLRIYSMKSNLWYPICETTQYVSYDSCFGCKQTAILICFILCSVKRRM
jgi:chromosome transmission fidelity protein 4